MLERFRNPLLRQIEAVERLLQHQPVRRPARAPDLHHDDVRVARRARAPAGSAAEAVRERAARDTGIEFLEIAEFELALARLRVPELV